MQTKNLCKATCFLPGQFFNGMHEIKSTLHQIDGKFNSWFLICLDTNSYGHERWSYFQGLPYNMYMCVGTW